ncbi:MAG: hypothetical protein ACRDOU_14540 [Streptosporangiaceae bacterium]
MTPLPPDESGVEGLGSGETDGLPEPGEVVVLFDGEADARPEGPDPLQLAAGVGVGVCVAARRDVLARGLGLALADTVAEALSLALAVSPGLALSLPVALPFGLALALAVSPGLAVSLLWDGLAVLGDAVTLGLVGALVDAVARAVLDVLGVAEPDACDWDGDVHGTADGLRVIPADALPSTPLGPVPRPVPPVPAGLADVLDDPLPVRSSLAWTSTCRSGGTAASTTATANTATPMASAGRSMASRQSRGHRWAGRACPGPAPRPGARPGRGGTPWPRGALCSPRPPNNRRTRPPRTPEPRRPDLAPASGSVAEA